MPHRVDERPEVDRLHDVRVRAQLVAADKVLLFARRREHDDRDRLERFVGLQRAEHIEAVDLRHLEIQQQDRWIAFGPIRILVPAIQIVERLRAVAHDDHFVRQVDFAECRERQLDVVRIVFREYDPFQFSHHADILIEGPASLCTAIPASFHCINS